MDENKRDDGGSAFPNDGAWANGVPEGGMSLRDYLASKFMVTAFEEAAQPKEYVLREIFGGQTGLRREDIASAFAYRMADAMIKRRNR